jgi:flagella basal body P-ring formation protein FlgA
VRRRLRAPVAGLLVLVALLAVAAPALAALAVVRVAQAATVHDEHILLGDVATVEGDAALAVRLRALRLGPAPAPGATHTLEADALRRRLRLGTDAPRVSLVVPDRVVVTRAAQIVTGEAIVDAARREVLERLARRRSTVDGGEPLALVPLGAPPDVRVPDGDLTLRVRVDDGPLGSGFVATTVTVAVRGRDWHGAAVTFRVSRYRRVVVMTSAVAPRATLGPRDLVVESRPATEVPPDALDAVGEPSELEAQQALGPGDVLTARAVRPRTLVRRGEIVTLVLEGDHFRITTQGLAGADGRRGETVRVVNPVSKREILGSVEGPGVVRVPFRSARAPR